MLLNLLFLADVSYFCSFVVLSDFFEFEQTMSFNQNLWTSSLLFLSSLFNVVTQHLDEAIYTHFSGKSGL